MWLNHIRNIGLPGNIVMFAQPAIIACVGGDAVQSQPVLRGINFVQETMQRQNARPLRFAEHLPRR